MTIRRRVLVRCNRVLQLERSKMHRQSGSDGERLSPARESFKTADRWTLVRWCLWWAASHALPAVVASARLFDGARGLSAVASAALKRAAGHLFGRRRHPGPEARSKPPGRRGPDSRVRGPTRAQHSRADGQNRNEPTSSRLAAGRCCRRPRDGPGLEK